VVLAIQMVGRTTAVTAAAKKIRRKVPTTRRVCLKTA